MKFLSLRLFSSSVGIRTDSDSAHSYLTFAYEELIERKGNSYQDVDIQYRVLEEATTHYVIQREGREDIFCAGVGDFVFNFEQDLVVEIQKRHPDLFFLHSAVVEYKAKTIALLAPSGSGKSTITWGLLHNGFSYLTDEMCAIDPQSHRLDYFMHALSLKAHPPSYDLPRDTLKTSRSYLIPVRALPSRYTGNALKLDMIFYVAYTPALEQPQIQSISCAESCARFYANGLNQLAHNHFGLDAAAAISSRVKAYTMQTADLEKSCQLIKDVLESGATA